MHEDGEKDGALVFSVMRGEKCLPTHTVCGLPVTKSRTIAQEDVEARVGGIC